MLKIEEHLPGYINNGLCYLTVGGSTAYGTASVGSDIDLIGIYVPPRINMYPQEYGYIQGFDVPPAAVETHQVHHVYDDNGVEYDINIFHIVKFFNLAAAGNPNIIDAISTKPELHKFKNTIGRLIYHNRKLFISNDMYPKFRGMIKNHMATIAKAQTGHGHAELIEKHGYDTKDAAHSIRVLFSLIDILTDGDYRPDAHAQVIRDIRNGVYTLKDMLSIYELYNHHAESLIKKSTLQDTVDKEKVKRLLNACLQVQYLGVV